METCSYFWTLGLIVPGQKPVGKNHLFTRDMVHFFADADDEPAWF
jgi:hypothetical protein